MTNEINPALVDRGQTFRVIEKGNRYFGHTGIVRAVYNYGVTLELDVDADGHLVTFEWEQVTEV